MVSVLHITLKENHYLCYMESNEHKQVKIVQPEDYYCIWCAVNEGELVDAEFAVWSVDIEKMMPLCSRCLAAIEEEEKLFRGLSIN